MNLRVFQRGWQSYSNIAKILKFREQEISNSKLSEIAKLNYSSQTNYSNVNYSVCKEYTLIILLILESSV